VRADAVAGRDGDRISVSSWRTTLDDAAHAADVIVACAGRVGGG